MIGPTTCKDCVYNVASVDNNTKEIIKICVRFPPVTHMLGTQQGIAVSTAYPMINNDLIACGEWDDGSDIEVDHGDDSLSSYPGPEDHL